MLRAEHHAIVYARPTFRMRLGMGARQYRDALRSLLPVHEAQIGPSISHMGDSESVNLEEFMRRYEQERQSLAMRKLHGEDLSPKEEIMLQSINAQLDRLLPAPEKMPEDVALAVREARRLSRRAAR
jgi:hypothetical protein